MSYGGLAYGGAAYGSSGQAGVQVALAPAVVELAAPTVAIPVVVQLAPAVVDVAAPALSITGDVVQIAPAVVEVAAGTILIPVVVPVAPAVVEVAAPTVAVIGGESVIPLAPAVVEVVAAILSIPVALAPAVVEIAAATITFQTSVTLDPAVVVVAAPTVSVSYGTTPPAANLGNLVTYEALVMEDPSTPDGHTQGWQPYSQTTVDAWRWRILVDGVDVTTVQGRRTLPASPLVFAEPYGETTASLVVHGVTRWTLADYSWCRPGADVLITKHHATTGADLGVLGSFVVYDLDVSGGKVAGGAVVLLCSGALSGPAGVTHYKPTLEGQTGGDVGTLIEAALTFPSQRHTFEGATVGVTWDDPATDFGASAATVLARADRLLLEAYTTGRWTVGRTGAPAAYELRLKDTTTVDATVTLGTPGVEESLRQSLADSPNIIYGSYSTADLPADSAWRTAPLAAISGVSEYVFSGSTGEVIGLSGAYDASKPRVERYVNVGNFVTRARAEQLADRLIYDPDDLPWFGKVELSVGVPSGDYGGSGAPAGLIGPLDFQEGMNVRVRGLPGAPLLHVAGVELDLPGGTATLTLDEAARDWTEIEALLSKDNPPADTSSDPSYSYSGYTGGGLSGGYYYGSGGGGGGGGTYITVPAPFLKSATGPTYLPDGWGWLRPVSP